MSHLPRESFEYEGVTVRIVPRDSIDGRMFYVSRDGKKGCNVMPDGSIKNCNATPTTCPNSKYGYDRRRKERYLQFKDVFGYHKPILAAHAVWLAWSNQPIPQDCQIHHLTGIVTDNNLDNLLCLSKWKQHSIADKRQKAIKAVVPDGNLHLFSYERLRELQDPRTMADEDFEKELEAIHKKGFHTDPSIDEIEPLKHADPYEH